MVGQMIAPREPFQRTPHVAVFLFLFSYCFFAPAVHAQTDALEQLQRRLDEREKVISELIRRVEILEQRLSERPAARASEPGGKTSSIAASNAAPSDAAAPATDIDDEPANRALERALSREGGLILPRGAYELEPAITYGHHTRDAARVVTVQGQGVVSQEDLKRDTLGASLALRFGLPWRSQIELNVPYAHNRENIATDGATQQVRNRSGWGDLELGWTTQLMRERGAAPSLFGTVNWKTATGRFSRNDDISPGSGFHSVLAGLTAVKRQDPLVFHGTLFHAFNLQKNISGIDIDPGNTTGLRLGTILAASPDTSLRLAFVMNRTGRTELNGAKQPGTDSSVAMLELGVGSLLSATTLLDLRVAIGLTPASPNFRIGLALPMRF